MGRICLFISAIMSQARFNEIILDHLENILNKMQQTINSAGVNFSDINAIFYTGGSTKIPLFREKINLLFPNAKVVQGDFFGSVGLGLTIDAQRKYGVNI